MHKGTFPAGSARDKNWTKTLLAFSISSVQLREATLHRLAHLRSIYTGLVRKYIGIAMPKEKNEESSYSSSVLEAESALHSAATPRENPNSATGIFELDRMLDGGFPKGSVILVAGPSGSGKTVLSFQWLFEGTKAGERGVYLTLTEPLIKTMKNLETMGFYDKHALEEDKLRIVDIHEMLADRGLEYGKIIEYVEARVKETNAKRLCLDSVTAIAYSLDNKATVRKFIFELGKALAAIGCTTILTSEVSGDERYSVYGVEEFISDAIVRLDQVNVRNELLRRIEVVKVRGRRYRGETLYFRIESPGIVIFPKMRVSLTYSASTERLSTGVHSLDSLFYGGLFAGSSTLVSGPTGTGKSLLSLQFLLDGLKKGEACLFVGYEESREQILRNAAAFGWDLSEYERDGLLTIRCVYPTEKSLDEHLLDIRTIVESKNIRRSAIDSLSAIYADFPAEDVSDFSRRLNGYLKLRHITNMFTFANDGPSRDEPTGSMLSTTADNLLTLRHVEMDGHLGLVMNIPKSRGSSHSKDLVSYTISSRGIVLGQTLAGYEGVITGVSRKVSETVEEMLEAEFKRYLGPMGLPVFQELYSEGLSKDRVLSYIRGLEGEKILRREDAEKFALTAAAIMEGGQNDPGKKMSDLDLLKAELLRKSTW